MSTSQPTAPPVLNHPVDSPSLRGVRTEASCSIPVWHLRVGDVFSAPRIVPGGPMRVDFIGVLPGMRKLFLARPGQPVPSEHLSAADLRLIPHCTLGDDVVVALVDRPAADAGTPAS